MPSRRLVGRLLVATACAVLFAWLAVRMVRPDREGLKQALRTVSLPWIGVYFIVTVLAQSARTIRWAVLLRPLGTVPWRRLVPISLVGYMAAFSLPALGEIARPYLIRDKDGVRGTAAFATVVIERVFDGLSVALVAFLAFWPLRHRTDAPWIDAFCFGTLGLFLGVLLAMVILRWKRQWAFAVIEKGLQPMSPRLASAVDARVRSFVDGLGALPNQSVLARVIGLTVIYWLLNGLAFQVIGKGFGYSFDLQVTWATIGLIVLGYFIPAPGQVGTFHFFTSVGLGLFLSDTEMSGRGAALVITMHVFQVLFFAGGGLVALFSPEIRWWRGRGGDFLESSSK